LETVLAKRAFNVMLAIIKTMTIKTVATNVSIKVDAFIFLN
jgi:hypothetical protein